MTWQLTAFGLLAVALAAGLAWYERSRPTSRTVALVAALAALAVAGRLVLAPIPNVVATTDIALITGYALGGAPGFAVGALAAPVSNFWLGQGPWTPWQMAGWGLAGLAGAALAAATGRRLGRIGLALACGLAGLAYGALLDLSVMVGYGGEQSLDRYLALSARGIPFNVAHAAGNFAIALAAGPALVRMISRYRTRLEFTWHRTATPLALLAGLVLAGAAAEPPPAPARAPASARAWLERAQNPDGGYGFEPGARSSAQMTGWGMLGLEGAGRNPLDVATGGRTPVEYLRTKTDSLRRSVGSLELAILGLEGAGVNARRFGGHDLVNELRRLQSGDGSFQGQVNLTAYGLLSLRAAGSSSGVRPAAAWLRGAQNGDGGWGTNASGRSDPDSTGSALQALGVAGGGLAVRRGVGYLRRTQKREGGWGIYETGVTNSQSTSFAVMGLVAAGVDPGSLRRRGRSGLSYMAGRQAADGHYAYSTASDQTSVWVTAQALLALGREALPIEPVSRSSAAPRPDPDLRPGPTGASQRVPAGPAPSRVGGVDDGGRGTGDGPRRERGGQRGMGERRTGPAGARAELPGFAIAEPASRATGLADDSDSDTRAWVAAGFGALAATLAGGFLWYRRRLPS